LKIRARPVRARCERRGARARSVGADLSRRAGAPARAAVEVIAHQRLAAVGALSLRDRAHRRATRRAAGSARGHRAAGSGLPGARPTSTSLARVYRLITAASPSGGESDESRPDRTTKSRDPDTRSGNVR
jgi:hypothetical protein